MLIKNVNFQFIFQNASLLSRYVLMNTLLTIYKGPIMYNQENIFCLWNAALKKMQMFKWESFIESLTEASSNVVSWDVDISL